MVQLRKSSALTLLIAINLCVAFVSISASEAIIDKSRGFAKVFRHGEKDFGDYSGAQQNIIYQDDYGHLKSHDEKLSQKYISSLFMDSFFNQLSFYRNELAAGIFCPDHTLDKHFSSLRYYFRLLSLSHLYEVIKLYQRFNTCSFDMDEVLSACKPESDWLGAVIKLARIAPSLKSSLVDESIYFARRNKSWCKGFRNSSGVSCNGSKRGERKVQEAYCQQDIKDFKLICSEQDKLFGMSQLQLPYWILKRTHITEQFDSEELALGCMKRFSQVMKNYESIPKGLYSLFRPVYEALPKSYKEGGVFAYGSLQKYGELKKLFSDSFKPSKKIVAIKDKQVEILALRQEPIIKKKAINVRKLPVLKKKKVTPRKSAFYQACTQRMKYDLKEASVNMLKFHYDLVLTGAKKIQADALLEKFRQRKVLESMKKHEKLGSSQAPVPLVFIKYLIDTRDYQGLFNMIGVLGNEFFIKNDFDIKQDKCRLEKSRLIYNKSKKAWLLSILKYENQLN